MAVCRNFDFVWEGGGVVVVLQDTSFVLAPHVRAGVRKDFHWSFAFHNGYHYSWVAEVEHGVVELYVWKGGLGDVVD
jgi:hypothetical protein